ncbi:helix-turn-helix domain-containing protein [Halocatena halophila]|uniref:helix-turn-helix domain-containing protein n=1 Tax=Halocatena halophila TaxID=2814576 RepID=UPI002ED28E1F
MIEECLIVEFAIDGDNCPLADATAATGVGLSAQPPQLRPDGNSLVRFSATATAADTLTRPLDGDDRLRYLHRVDHDDRATFRCLSKQPCVVHDLVSEGLLLESLGYNDGTATVRGAVVGYTVLAGVRRRAEGTVGISIQRISPLKAGGSSTTSMTTRWGLTPKQLDAIRTARRLGYFEQPRRADASDVAAALEISKSAFLERLRRAERTVFTQLF